MLKNLQVYKLLKKILNQKGYVFLSQKEYKHKLLNEYARGLESGINDNLEEIIELKQKLKNLKTKFNLLKKVNGHKTTGKN